MTRRVRVADLLPESIELEMPDGEVYELQPLGVKEMTELFLAERALAATRSDEGLSPQERTAQMYDGLRASNDAINSFLRSRFPDRADAIDYDLPPIVIGEIFQVLAGSSSETIADEVQAALQDGSPGPTPGETAASPEDAAAGASGAEDGSPAVSGTPLASTKGSPTSSTTSAPSSDGDRSPTGAPESPGASSEEPSGSSESAAAA